MLESGYTLGFLGCGNMGTAVLRAAIAGVESSSGDVLPGRYVVSVRSDKSRQRISELFGSKVIIAEDNQQVVDESHVVVLAFKPTLVKDILSRLHYTHFTVLVSLLAGTTIDTIRQHTSVNAFIVRATTNIAAQIGEAMTALSFQGAYHPDSPITLAIEWLFNQTGKYIVVDESKQDVCMALCGSGTAFTSIFLESLAEGAVKMGLPYETALECAAQVLKGSAVLSEGFKHPALMRPLVMTPGGTTINGIYELESRGFRAATMRAVEKATEVATELGTIEDSGTRSLDASRTQSSLNLAEMAQQLSISRRNTLNIARQPTQ